MKQRARVAALLEPARWRIERLVPGGDGLARLPDGKVGFATGAFPGDVIEVREVEFARDYQRAVSYRLLEPSRERVPLACPVAARCGGCDWMGLSRGAQERAKSELLRDALQRVGRLKELPPSLPVVSAGPTLGYRQRVQFHVDARGHIGFYARGTHELVEIPACPAAHPDIDAVLGSLREIAGRHASAFAAFDRVDVRVASRGPSPLLVLHKRKRPRQPDTNGRSYDSQPSPGGVAAFLRELSVRYPLEVASADGTVKRRRHADQEFTLADGTELRVPAQSFVQVHWAVNSILVRDLVEGARTRGARRFYDLFCGVGNFALPLARAGLAGVGVDRVAVSIEAARRAAEAQRIVGVEFVVGEVSAWLRSQARSLRVDLVVLDPPRAGARALVDSVAALNPAHIAICSCDPATLARDVGELVRRGYRLAEVSGYDMFPETHHLETLAWLERIERHAEVGEPRNA